MLEMNLERWIPEGEKKGNSRQKEKQEQKQADVKGNMRNGANLKHGVGGR